MLENPVDWLTSWGLPDPPSRKAVVLAYRRRAQKLHPDRAGNTPQANEGFIELRRQYELILQYADNPSFFRRPRPEPEPVKPPPPMRETPVYSSSTSPNVVFYNSRPIPAANLTVRIPWPLSRAWLGGREVLSFARSHPCECRFGCDRCSGTRMLFNRVKFIVEIPPIPTINHSVRLRGQGHKYNKGLLQPSGDVLVELGLKNMYGWREDPDGAGLIQLVRVPRGAFWAYCRHPSGSWARLDTSVIETLWVSPGGLRATVRLVPARVEIWAKLVQAICAWSWGLTSPGLRALRYYRGLRALLGRETERSS